MKTKLGSSIEYPQKYTPEVLDFIPRDISYRNQSCNFYGFDIWHAYEFSWIDKDSNPENAVLRIVVPCESEFIVESKSLKLYLNGFALEKISSLQEVTNIIQNDLTNGIKATVEVQALYVEAPELMPKIPIGYCLDLHSLKNPEFKVNPRLLKTGYIQKEEILFTNTFRSLCPVTGQPDWATVLVMYRGKEIYPDDLRSYLVSYRQHQGFHETCCERIFFDIVNECYPEELGVMCSFTRRGGIDITPIRSNSLGNRMKFFRTIRQ